MGFLDFLKRVPNKDKEVKKLTLLEVEDYIDSWSKTTFSNTTTKLEEIKILVEEEKNKTYKNIFESISAFY